MISKAWIKQRETLLECTKAGPIKDEMIAELEAAKAQRAKEEAELAPFLEAGFKVNGFPGKCSRTGAQVKAGEGFTRKAKTKAGGEAWFTYSASAAAEIIAKR